MHVVDLTFRYTFYGIILILIINTSISPYSLPLTISVFVFIVLIYRIVYIKNLNLNLNSLTGAYDFKIREVSEIKTFFKVRAADYISVM